MSGEGNNSQTKRKNFEKSLKKLLTNGTQCAIMSMLKGDATSVLDACTTD
jgi:hypothetical protein